MKLQTAPAGTAAHVAPYEEIIRSAMRLSGTRISEHYRIFQNNIVIENAGATCFLSIVYQLGLFFKGSLKKTKKNLFAKWPGSSEIKWQ